MQARLWRRAPRWMVAVVVRLMGCSGERGTGNGEGRMRATEPSRPHRATSHRRTRMARSPPSIERPDERIRRVVLELGVVAEKGQLDRVGRTVSLLADDDLGQAFVRR